jgi:hypothetical protein
MTDLLYRYFDAIDLSGPEFAYLGHFRDPARIAIGHNTLLAQSIPPVPNAGPTQAGPPAIFNAATAAPATPSGPDNTGGQR